MGRLIRKNGNPSSWIWVWTLAKGLLVLYTMWLFITGILVIFRTRDTASTITNPVTLWWETLAGFLVASIILISHLIFTRGMRYGDKMSGSYVFELFMLKCALIYAVLFVLFAVFRWDYCDDVDCKMLTHQIGGISPAEKDIHDRLLTYKLLNTILVFFSGLLLLAVFDKSYYGSMFSTLYNKKPTEQSTPKLSQKKFNVLED